MAKVKRTRYVSPEGLVIVLEVPEPPMGSGSGYIPPPAIKFFHQGHELQFNYAGDE